jgi:hypothetical protein
VEPKINKVEKATRLLWEGHQYGTMCRKATDALEILLGRLPKEGESFEKIWADVRKEIIVLMANEKKDELKGLSFSVDGDILIFLRDMVAKEKNASKVINEWLRKHMNEQSI